VALRWGGWPDVLPVQAVVLEEGSEFRIMDAWTCFRPCRVGGLQRVSRNAGESRKTLGLEVLSPSIPILS